MIYEAEAGLLCGACFATAYMPMISFILGLFYIAGLCFLNHAKNKKEPALKWYVFIFYIVIAIVAFVIVNAGILMLGDVLNLGPHNSF